MDRHVLLLPFGELVVFCVVSVTTKNTTIHQWHEEKYLLVDVERK